MKSTKCNIYCETNVGKKRKNNEDQTGFLNTSEFQVLLVADGMGGHLKGEVASDIVKTVILGLLENEPKPKNDRKARALLKKVIKKANSEIYKLSTHKDDYYGMGTTLVMAFVLDDETYIINCGDSRAYAYKNDKLNLLTVDQTCVEYLYKLGVLSKEEIKTHPRKHVLMNALGIDSTVNYDISKIDNSSYDYLLLCSDGLTNMIEKEDIQNIIKENKDMGVEEITHKLINTALENGGADNVSVCLMEVK